MSLAKSRIKIYANDLVLWGSLFKSRKVFDNPKCVTEHLTLAIRPIFNDLGHSRNTCAVVYTPTPHLWQIVLDLSRL
ncbi:hypothetical protein ERO13_D09G052954v2 [Gossypium hirsutum]|uniref:Uncharacterized protein n=1 Tax=Gossypium tomentosum TaxID=34277 RepID=A0A5D2JG34_GOSTO|nr:hypothetical protein ERO13_D09G052954v2 [Gossypium hirsutum]TYH52973.1 hypothetical protein ES332_D09G065700v1 [Gossypium tomentosum]